MKQEKDTKNLTITKTAFFNMPPKDVWPYLTNARKISHWFLKTDNDFIENQTFELYKEADNGDKKPIVWGKIIHLQPPTKLIYTFLSEAFKNTPSTVTIELNPTDHGTRLTLIHTGIKDALEDAALDYTLSLDKGWEQHINHLRDAISNG